MAVAGAPAGRVAWRAEAAAHSCAKAPTPANACSPRACAQGTSWQLGTALYDIYQHEAAVARTAFVGLVARAACSGTQAQQSMLDSQCQDGETARDKLHKGGVCPRIQLRAAALCACALLQTCSHETLR